MEIEGITKTIEFKVFHKGRIYWATATGGDFDYDTSWVVRDNRKQIITDTDLGKEIIEFCSENA